MIACSQLLLYQQECETFGWSEEEHDTKRKRKSDEHLGSGAYVAGSMYDLARLAGRRDCLEYDPSASRRLHRGVGVDSKRLHLELRGAAHDWRGARRPLRASAPVRRRPGVVRTGVGGLRTCAECWLADRRTRSAGVWVGTGDAAGAAAVKRGIPS